MISIADHKYQMSCPAQDRQRLLKLASYVDEKAKSLKEKLGHIAESRLLVMTAILLADELDEAHQGSSSLTGFKEEDLASILDEVSQDIERLAQSSNQK